MRQKAIREYERFCIRGLKRFEEKKTLSYDDLFIIITYYYD